MGIVGQNFDPSSLIEPARFMEFIHAETGRTDLEIGECSTISYYKYASQVASGFMLSPVYMWIDLISEWWINFKKGAVSLLEVNSSIV
jgi:hypothetical protein